MPVTIDDHGTLVIPFTCPQPSFKEPKPECWRQVVESHGSAEWTVEQLAALEFALCSDCSAANQGS